MEIASLEGINALMIRRKFYQHKLLQKYDWYWRLEPEIKYFCDITYDPFIHMERANKTYGFTIAVKELRETVPNIHRYASAFRRKNNIASRGMWEMFIERPDEELNEEELLHRQRERIERGEDIFGHKKEDKKQKKKNKKLARPHKAVDIDPQAPEPDYIDEDAMEGEKYNMCHFWSNFEIARLDWFRSKEYNDFFDTMDRSGGFWNERVSRYLNWPCSRYGAESEIVGRCSHPFPRCRCAPQP